MSILLVMIGGFFGSISRYMLGEWLYTENGFPIGTLSVNLLGCFFLAWFLTFITQKKWVSPNISLLIGTGFTGSFTTFSTFSVESIQLLQHAQILSMIVYVVASVAGGLALSYFGHRLAYRKVEERGEAG
ncbi:fluoride efflux transporter CrcB [Bacillus sp. Marseille-Q3570]|uniref:fluoride efflux transporter CrcB n=1 Tax=Bacillus sp. Marseille-Q3570 TaxID=2963522 RepID=UPI0021B78746|nr:fluoride efflux transporter CrcB [Bacillus sp. Marseille-Q3570]